MSGAIEAAAPRSALDALLSSRPLILRDFGFYGVASAAALALDWLVLTLLVGRGLPAAVAAAIGFSLGMLVTYAASIGVIFTDRRHGSRWRELTLFVVIGLAGLGLNVLLILAFGALLGLSAPIAKAPAAGIVFLFNFATRRALLFAKRPEA